MTSTEPGPVRVLDRKLLTRTLRYLRPYTSWMALTLGAVLFMTLCTNLLPVLVKQAIDEYLVAGGDLTPAERVHGVLRVAGAYLGLALVAFGFRYGQAYALAWIGQHVILDIRADVFATILNLPFRAFDRQPVGRLMTRVTSDVENMQKALTEGVISLVADLVALLGALGFMLYLSPYLTLAIVGVVPLIFAVMLFLNRRIRSAHRAVRQRQADLNAYLQEMISGMLTIQVFNREEPARLRFAGLNRDLQQANILSVRWFSYFFPSMEVLGAFTFGVVLCLGGTLMLNGSDAVTLGILVAFIAYIRDFFRPLEDLSDKSNSLQAALASAERLFELMDAPAEIRDPERPQALRSFRGEVDFDHVWFAYADEDWVLRDVSLHIGAGESVALVGATGAGKTSVVSLLARFYDVQKGAVRVDGHDVRALRQNDLRRRIGIVLQDPFVFSGTVASNISLHNPELTRAHVEQAARYVNADSFIGALPAGYDTVLRERGSDLSTGQKQLLALARALAQNPDILLILDEATANVDTETEQLIQDALQKLMHGRTSIIIAHRLSTIRHVDRILVMRQGAIVEQGSHADLLEEGGYYKRLYDLLSHPAVS